VVAPPTDQLTDQNRVLREDCGLLDRSERGKLALTGAGAKEFLNGQVSNDVEALAPGEGLYAALLTHKGKMLADVRVLDLGDELFLDSERSALQDLGAAAHARDATAEAAVRERLAELPDAA